VYFNALLLSNVINQDNKAAWRSGSAPGSY